MYTPDPVYSRVPSGPLKSIRASSPPSSNQPNHRSNSGRKLLGARLQVASTRRSVAPCLSNRCSRTSGALVHVARAHRRHHLPGCPWRPAQLDDSPAVDAVVGIVADQRGCITMRPMTCSDSSVCVFVQGLVEVNHLLEYLLQAESSNSGSITTVACRAADVFTGTAHRRPRGLRFRPEPSSCPPDSRKV